MNKEFALLKSAMKNDYPYMQNPEDSHTCFCTNTLFDPQKMKHSMQKYTFRNLFFNFCGSNYFFASIYACLENGAVKSDICNATLNKEEILEWSFSFIKDVLGEKNSTLNAFGICLIDPNDQTKFKRFFVYKK